MAYTFVKEKGSNTIHADGLKDKDAFVDAARGLFASMYDFENIRGRDERVKIVVQGASLDDLLKAWLTELLERQSIHSIMYGSISVASLQKLKGNQYLLTGAAYGESYTQSNHPELPKVKLKSGSVKVSKKQNNWTCDFQLSL